MAKSSSKLLVAFASTALLLNMSLLPTAQAAVTTSSVEAKAQSLEKKVIQWRRHLHENPELSNREFETAKYIEKHLRRLGLEVETGIAHTGLVATLKGGKPGPVIALRADMDGLPVKEETKLDFASKAMGKYNGETVNVMHACGHDAHMSILMGTAEILTGMKSEIAGTIKFIFQPAEEGTPVGEEGGAELMVKQGVLKNPDVEAIFGLHIISTIDSGSVQIRSEGLLASVDNFKITVKGKQAHGAKPWLSVDPIVTAAQIVNGLQTIVSRNMPLTSQPSVVTVGSIHGGVRSNIIPEQVEMLGTIRTFSEKDRKDIADLVTKKATLIGQSMGAEVEVKLPYTSAYPVTYNNIKLTEQMLPTLESVFGKEQVIITKPVTWAEDFSFYAQKVPGVFFFLGGKPLTTPQGQAPAHHTPKFFIEEDSLVLGVEAMTRLALDYLESAK